MLAIARGGQKAGELPEAAYGLFGQSLGHGPKSHRFDRCFDFALLARLLLL